MVSLERIEVSCKPQLSCPRKRASNCGFELKLDSRLRGNDRLRDEIQIERILLWQPCPGGKIPRASPVAWLHSNHGRVRPHRPFLRAIGGRGRVWAERRCRAPAATPWP